MRTAIIIPARLAATRLPGKPLKTLGGVPLVVRVAEQARKCRDVDMVVVATDAQEIFDAVTAHGHTAIMTSEGHESGTDRVAEAAATVGSDTIINLQGDEPFVDPADLSAVARALKQGLADVVTLKAKICHLRELDDPNVVKVVTQDDGLALYFSRAPIPFDRDGKWGIRGAWRHVGLYGYQRDALRRMAAAPPHALERCERLEQLRALAMGLSIAVLPAKTAGRGIDTAADLAWARRRVRRLGDSAFAQATPEDIAVSETRPA